MIDYDCPILVRLLPQNYPSLKRSRAKWFAHGQSHHSKTGDFGPEGDKWGILKKLGTTEVTQGLKLLPNATPTELVSLNLRMQSWNSGLC